MYAINRPSAAAGVALAVSGLIAATPLASPPDLTRARVMSADVRLVDADAGLLGDFGLSSLSSLFGDAASSGSGGLFDGSLLNLLNIPYNIVADIINIPYTESQALAEYAYALGPAGTTGGVEGWIPPGATVADGGATAPADLGGLYTEGGTGSWWMESIGNTWGWDDGNWPQLDAIMHFILPLQWTEGLAESVQSVAQQSLIDGSAGNCEFECSNLVGYLGGWLTGLVHAFSTSDYPTTQTDTIGENVKNILGEIVNIGKNIGSPTDTAIWSGQPDTINPVLNVIEAVWQNAIEPPKDNPIQLPQDVLPSLALLGKDLVNDFDPFIQGSFLYWGADNLYSIPSVIGGLVHTLSLGLIPNEFTLPGNGAEPVSGYGDGPGQLLPNLEQGFQYLIDGLVKYVDPNFAGFGADASTAAAASTDAGTLLGSLDQGGLLTELTSTLGPNLGTDLATLFPHLTADLTAMFPDLAAALIP